MYTEYSDLEENTVEATPLDKLQLGRKLVSVL